MYRLYYTHKDTRRLACARGVMCKRDDAPLSPLPQVAAGLTLSYRYFLGSSKYHVKVLRLACAIPGRDKFRVFRKLFRDSLSQHEKLSHE